MTLWIPTKQNNKTKKSVAPIVVPDHESDIQTILTELKLDCNLKLNSVGRKIYPKTIEDKNKIIDQLKTKQIGFFSHPENNDKTFKVILSGLPEIDTACIVGSLKHYTIKNHNVQHTIKKQIIRVTIQWDTSEQKEYRFN